MSPRDVVRERLARQLLTTPGPDRASDVVRTLGAVQAQDYAGAKWALAQRTRGATDADVERELAHGSILRTHVLRPTWHFVAPEDIRWMLALTAPRVKAAMASADRALGLAPEVVGRALAALTKALAGGEHFTRVELGGALRRAGIEVPSGRWLAHLMMRAELDAVVCSGPHRGRELTYALLDERVPPAPALDRDEALLRLTRRYFATRGPATAHDFAWWSGLAMADVKRGLQIAAPELERITLDGRELWLTGGAPPRSRPSAHLLPNYDEYFIGYKDRGAIAGRLGDAKLVLGGSTLITHVVVCGGELVGWWRRTVEEQAVVVELTMLTPLTPAERRRIAAAAQRFGDFVGTAAELRLIAR